MRVVSRRELQLISKVEDDECCADPPQPPLSEQEAEPIAKGFAALADPTRRAILSRLAEGEASVTELAEPFDMTMPAVSKHLKVLERAGLVSRSRDAQRRPCRLEARPLRAAIDWLENYREYWEESYQRLDALLAAQRRSQRRSGQDGP
ncbi:MAG: metalloregulator ArsR/SmtB family transcription factor [Actinobacteria bacterium]|nr:metalloregulator ArsR/SmtB family transcription factor [Actinomycetota bacterium]